MTETVELKSGLYVTATPIGNLKDITLRALEVLKAVDVVACEDTRVSGKLLSHYGIRAKLVAYHEHNAARLRPKLLARLRDGARVALISDAGTPLISDPGMKLVAEAREQGFYVTPIPGPSAAMAALAAAGLPTDSFSFFGFLPGKARARAQLIDQAREAPGTLVFFENAKRLPATLMAMEKAYGSERKVSICRELTKLHEEVLVLPLGELVADIGARDSVKGEIVILVAPAASVATDEEKRDRAILKALDHLSVREAASAVSYATGLPRREIYARALELKDTGQ
jgi:16S rRNA (cytidine1402-2'-O)-methyltransferase